MRSEDSVRHQLGSTPIAEGMFTGAIPLYAERYLLQGHDRQISGVPMLRLATLLDGAVVREGKAAQWRTITLPGQTLLVPPQCSTRWKFSGATDVGVFYFVAPHTGIAERFLALSTSYADPIQFFDALVSNTARQIFHELQKGGACDDHFVEKLVEVMLEQSFRALSTPEIQLFSPRHVHFNRLQKVLPYIRNHLTEDLSAETLAKLAGVSATHFRRLFQEALGVSVHRYVQAARLELARKLLSTSSLPIAQIAGACGFANQSHLTACFSATHAVTPAVYRKTITRTRS